MCSKAGYVTPEPSISSRHLLAAHKEKEKVKQTASASKSNPEFDRSLRLATLALQQSLHARQAMLADAPLKVGVAQYAPYAMKDETTGQWGGFAVEIVDIIFTKMGKEYELVEGSVAENLKALEDGEIDTFANGIFLSSRMKKLHPTWSWSSGFWMSGMSVMVKSKVPSTMSLIFSDHMWKMIGFLLLFLVGAGGIIWILERDPLTPSNLKDAKGNMVIPANPAPGIMTGAWFGLVTMTTVGYGDIAPKTWAGRLWGLILTLSSLFLVGMFTAEIATALTVSALEDHVVHSYHDLDHHHVAVVGGSMPHRFMSDRAHSKAVVHDYPTSRAACEALLSSPDIVAVVGMTDALQYQLMNMESLEGQTKIAGPPFHQHALALPFPNDKQLALDVTSTILALQELPDIDVLVQKYFWTEG